MNTNHEISLINELSHLKLQVYDRVMSEESFKHVFFDMPKVCRKEEFGILMLTTLVLSQLETFYREANLNIGFYLYVLGQSNSLKTTLSHFFTKFLDRSNFRSVMASLRADTPSALEYKMSIFRDFPLIIDDYYPGVDETEANSLKRKISFVTRKASERMTNGRMTGYMRRVPELPVRGVYIITAEDRLQGESNLARTLTVEIEHGDVNFELLDRYTSKQLLMLPTFIYHFRKYISSIAYKLPDLLKMRFDKCRSMYVNNHNTSYARMSEIYAYLLSALSIVLDFAKYIHALSKEEDRILFNKFLKTINVAIKKQVDMVNEYSPINMFCRVFNEGIILNKLKIEKIGIETNKIIDGWEDEAYYYFPENNLYNFIVNEYKKQNINFPLSKSELYKRLSSDDIRIIKYEETTNKDGSVSRRYSVKKTVCKGHRARVIWIDKGEIERI